MVREPGRLFGIEARFRTLTPMFLGGASQDGELRGPSIKAMLRFWHRAVDPKFRDSEPALPRRESVLWGGIERYAGQSKVLLAVTKKEPLPLRWREIDRRRFDEGQGRRRKNGLEYLGYPFGFREHQERQGFAPGSSFTLRATLRSDGNKVKLEPTDFRAVAASLWMLGHLGALGSRSRRGFGGLVLLDWQVFGPAPEDLRAVLDALPLLHQRSTREQWDEGLKSVLETMRGRGWFGSYLDDGWPHPHFGGKWQAKLGERSFGLAQWAEALNALGRRLQDFRARREPDYTIAKQHLQALGRNRKEGKYMRVAPGRVTFGLPLVFRFGSLTTSPSEMTLVPFEGEVQKERHPSLLFARLVQLEKGLHPLFLRLSGSVPGVDGGTTVGERRIRSSERRGGLRADHHALDNFMDSLE